MDIITPVVGETVGNFIWKNAAMSVYMIKTYFCERPDVTPQEPGLALKAFQIIGLRTILCGDNGIESKCAVEEQLNPARTKIAGVGSVQNVMTNLHETIELGNIVGWIISRARAAKLQGLGFDTKTHKTITSKILTILNNTGPIKIKMHWNIRNVEILDRNSDGFVPQIIRRNAICLNM
jgi:hypothetical protein